MISEYVSWHWIVFVVTFIVSKWVLSMYIGRKYRLPPGPRGWPFLGTLETITGPTLFRHRSLYGDVSSVKIFGTQLVILNSVQAIRDAFTLTHIFDDRPQSFVQKYVLPFDVSFNSSSEPYWKDLKHILLTQLKIYGRGGHELETIDLLELKHLKEELANQIEPVDLHSFLKPSVCNILYILAIGRRLPYDHKYNKLPVSYLQKFNTLIEPFGDRLLTTFPFIRFFPFGIGKIAGEVMDEMDDIYQFIESFVADKEWALPGLEDVTTSGFAFELFNNAKYRKTLNEKHLKGVIHDIFGAAIHTTVHTLYHFFLVLIHHPDVQKKIQQEIDDVIGDRTPTISDKTQMPYTSACIIELLRYGSHVALSLPHVCSQDGKLNGYDIPKGSLILTNLYRVHHDDQHWSHPWIYDPSRFLNNDGTLLPSKSETRTNVLAFGLGNRACPGRLFAKCRIFLYITHLLQRFEFKVGDVVVSCHPNDLIHKFVACPNRYKIKLVDRFDQSQ